MAGFIDGDLVEKFLDLPHPQMEEIARDVKVCVFTFMHVPKYDFFSIFFS